MSFRIVLGTRADAMHSPLSDAIIAASDAPLILSACVRSNPSGHRVSKSAGIDVAIVFGASVAVAVVASVDDVQAVSASKTPLRTRSGISLPPLGTRPH